MTDPTHTVRVRSQADIHNAVHAVRELASGIGMNTGSSAAIATAVSELVTNVVKYAHSGRVTFHPKKTENTARHRSGGGRQWSGDRGHRSGNERQRLDRWHAWIRTAGGKTPCRRIRNYQQAQRRYSRASSQMGVTWSLTGKSTSDLSPGRRGVATWAFLFRLKMARWRR